MLNRLKRRFKSNLQLAKENGVIIGKNVIIGSGCNFGSEPYLITLHDKVRLSFDVTFITHDGGTWAFRDIEKYKNVIKYGKIEIGENSFVGCKTILMPGIHIGKRCVIGAGSVVTHDIPDNSVACGVPAKVIMSTYEYAEKALENNIEYDEQEYLSDKKKFLIEHLDD